MKLILDLLLRLIRLAKGEFALAKAEMTNRLRRAAFGAVLLLFALILVILALGLLAGAMVELGLIYGLTPMQAQLAAAGGFAVVALLLGWMGARALRPRNLIPRQTLENVRRDIETLTGKDKS